MTAKKKDAIASLELLGLSAYESKAFFAAVGQPPITCYKLAQLSGVPRARIYEVVEKLAARGLLIFQPGDRTLLTAADYEKFLDQEESDHRQIIDGLRKTFAAVRIDESPGIWNIAGRAKILQTARELLSDSKQFVYLAVVAEDVEELKSEWSRLDERKIAAHGVYCGDLVAVPPGMVKHLGETCLKCGEFALVADGKQALIGCTWPEDAAAAALTKNMGLVNIAREHIRHEVFLNSLFGQEAQTAKESYIRKYRNLMRKLP
ncbi:MAG: TrmB family transcriptional regulator [Candidatus Aminicenantes bacterium]|nr:TrmB family transcriptional regulator [Candidatus Aminicenantes bacterium]